MAEDNILKVELVGTIPKTPSKAIQIKKMFLKDGREYILIVEALTVKGQIITKKQIAIPKELVGTVKNHL